MGRGKGRKHRKRNGAQGKNLTASDGKVSEPLWAMGFDQKEKRIFDISYVKGGHIEQILHEFPLQGIDDVKYSFTEDLSITTKDSLIITAKSSAGRLKSYSSTSAAAVGLDSQIYSIGGCCFDVDGSLGEDYGCRDGCNGFGHAAVFSVEVDGQPNKEWKRCRPMNIGRESPLACAVDGKIYVFGGAWIGPFIGEVYDPVEDKWECLPPLEDFPANSPIADMNVVMDDPKEANNKLILVHIQYAKPLYAFNVRRNKWETFDEGFGLGPLYEKRPTGPVCEMWPTNAVVDNVLYCYCTSTSPGRFFAYDLERKKWYDVRSIPESDQFHQTVGDNDPILFHLGGNTLCFLWSYGTFRGDSRDVGIGCAKFTVAVRNDKREPGLSLTQHSVGHFNHEIHVFGRVRYVVL